MTLNHIALWTKDIELIKEFYVGYFSLIASTKYYNPVKKFSSYFLSFPNGGSRLEIMTVPDISERRTMELLKGFCHISISVGSKEDVDRLTEKLRADGFAIIGNPRLTGDGYYESVIADPEGNLVEITI